MKHDGERLFTFRFVRGDQSKEFSFVIPAVIYRGIYKSGTYQAGDSVTYAGSTFIAKRETQAKPETEDWQLSSKRGRDGKDADRPDATERVVRLK